MNGDHEIWCGNTLVETLHWTGPVYVFPEAPPESVLLQRRAFRDQAIKRAFELRGLAYTRMNPNWKEIAHLEFDCKEVNETQVAATTPIGTFLIAARRVKAGEQATAVVVGSNLIGYGETAREDQISLPTRLVGRLLPPERSEWRELWLFQPTCFGYADGTVSSYLGSYPRRITWVQEPHWPK